MEKNRIIGQVRVTASYVVFIISNCFCLIYIYNCTDRQWEREENRLFHSILFIIQYLILTIFTRCWITIFTMGAREEFVMTEHESKKRQYWSIVGSWSSWLSRRVRVVRFLFVGCSVSPQGGDSSIVLRSPRRWWLTCWVGASRARSIYYPEGR